MNMALWIDGFVILLYFVLIVGIGLYAGRNNNTLKEFALGGHKIPWWAVLASIIAAETSAATFLGTPAEGYKMRNFTYAQLAIGTILARVAIAYLFIAPYFRHKVQSIYEFLTVRFGPRTKDMASGIFLIGRVLGIGVRLYLGGVILVVIWRYLLPDHPVTVWTYFWGIVFVTAVTTLYTAIGGIKAVVWTDLIQACLMLGAAAFAVATLYFHIPGGWETITDRLQWQDSSTPSSPGAFSLFFATGWDATKPFGEALRQLLESPYTILAALLGSTFLTMATHGTDQDMVQRMLTAENPQKSRLSLILSGFADIPIVLAFLAVGILLWVYYQVKPDPALPKATNEIFAHYIVHDMPVVIRGLIIAGVFATMMGSTSAALNALATAFIRDFYQPYINPSATDRQAVRSARMATAVFGFLMIIVATAAAYAVLQTDITIIPLALGVLGYGYGSLLGVFLLGVLTERRGHDVANVFAMLAGVAAVLVLGKVKIPAIDLGALLQFQIKPAEWNFGNFIWDWWPAISWPYFVFIGCMVTFGISVLFPTKKVHDAPSQTPS
jgi:solute:Na+ symporter, SSS family